MANFLAATPSCASCPIRHRAVCASCDADELSLLNSIKFYRTYEAGRAIVWEGDHMEFVASIVSGTATVERAVEDGRKQTVGLLLPSDFIGRPGRKTATFDVTAVTDVTLCCFQRKRFESLLEDTPHVAQRMLAMSLDELDAARDWMFLLGRKTAQEKVSSFLALILRRSSTPDGQQSVPNAITLPLTREAMADYLGLTLETVSRQFSKLKREGVIQLEGKRRIVIPDIAALRAAAGHTSDEAFI